MRKHFMVVLLLVGFLFTACSRETATSEVPITGPAMSVLITEANCPSLEVLPGTQVVWSNHGTQVHVVQTDPAADGSRAIDSGELKAGDSFAFTFLESGVYNYQCTPDGSMRGRITVR